MSQVSGHKQISTGLGFNPRCAELQPFCLLRYMLILEGSPKPAEGALLLTLEGKNGAVKVISHIRVYIQCHTLEI